MRSRHPKDSAAAPRAIRAVTGLHAASPAKITRKFKYPPTKLSIIRMPMFSRVDRPVVMELKMLPVLFCWKYPRDTRLSASPTASRSRAVSW